MKKILFSLFSLCIVTFTIAQDNALADFDKIKISGDFVVELFNAAENAYDVHVLKGKDSDVMIEVDKKGTLKIKSRYGYKAKKRLRANVKIYHDGINALEVSAGASVKSKEAITAENLILDSSSGASCQVVVEAENTKAESSSGARLAVRGSTGTLIADASSGSRLDAKELQADSVDAEASSGSSVSVWAAKTITAEASSGASIQYKGDPEEENISSGKYSGGNISKM